MKALITKINCFPIVQAHISTLVDASKASDKVFKIDIFTFYLLPLIVSIIFGLYIAPNESLINVLITSLSVFAALLFNLLILVLGVIEKRKGSNNFVLLQKETYANISYAILIALICVGFLLIPYFYKLSDAPGFQKFFWTVVYFLLFNFGLTMAMVLKRMHIILVKIIEI